MTIEASSLPNDVVWEPFGGLFSASLAAKRLNRRAFGCEIDPTYFQLGLSRFSQGHMLF
jgi:site-specific DNA-methyltransferase (adenine-specific)